MHQVKALASCETRAVLKKIINEAFEFGLAIGNLNDIVKFLMPELLIVLIGNEFIGRYFAHNE